MKYSHHQRRNPIPSLMPLGDDEKSLVMMAAGRILLPNPATVKLFNQAIFPTIRDPRELYQEVKMEDRTVGMRDDNTTPRWALLWTHGIPGKSKQPTLGWTIAHVWDRSQDLDAYTRLANLALIPEYLGGLSDNQGPLTQYLRYHAWQVYQWRPADADVPIAPAHYAEIRWNYLAPVADPVAFFRDEFDTANCRRSRVLKPLMAKELIC
jgi:hypothetical protein